MFTTIAHYTDPIEARLALGLLASEGIDAHLGDEHLVIANWEWRLAVGGIKLRVAREHADGARGAAGDGSRRVRAGRRAGGSRTAHARP